MESWLTYLQNIKEGIEGKPVSWYSDVFDIVFPNLNRDVANNLWKKELAPPGKDKKRSKKDDHDSDDDD